MSQYYVYILASISRTLYVGMTNDLARRVYEHRHKVTRGFSAKYKADRLVYFEMAESPWAAIAREKEIKGWLRTRKVELIESANPHWEDLAVELGLVEPPEDRDKTVAGTSVDEEQCWSNRASAPLPRPALVARTVDSSALPALKQMPVRCDRASE